MREFIKKYVAVCLVKHVVLVFSNLKTTGINASSLGVLGGSLYAGSDLLLPSRTLGDRDDGEIIRLSRGGGLRSHMLDFSAEMLKSN